MNRLNKKLLWLVLCVSNSSMGMNQLPKYKEEIPPRAYKKKLIDVEDEYCAAMLLKSVKAGRLLSVRQMLDYSPTLLRKPCGQKVLHEAIKNSQYRCFVLLLEYNASPNVLSDEGDVPLHVVNNPRMAQLLVDYGAWVDQKNNEGQVPLFNAIKNSSCDIARIFLKAGADINSTDNNKNTPLHYAVSHANPSSKVIKLLLYHGADTHQKNNCMKTPNQIALEKGGAVLEAFEGYEKVFCSINVREDNSPCFTVMNLLAHDGRQLKDILKLDVSGHCSYDIVIAEKLLQQCEDWIWDELTPELSPYSSELLLLVKLVKNRVNYREQFLAALRSNNFFMAKQLLQINPYLLHTYWDEYSSDLANDLFIDKLSSVPSIAPDYRHLREMLQYGFDVDVCDKFGMPLLCTVIKNNDGDKYRDLLKAGASVNRQDSYGNTPMFYAVERCDESKVLKLLEYGAAVNKNLYFQFTAMHPMRPLIIKVLMEQICFRCKTHTYDLSNIPCVNRHVGFFICTHCYDTAHFGAKKCPICSRSLGAFGS